MAKEKVVKVVAAMEKVVVAVAEVTQATQVIEQVLAAEAEAAKKEGVARAVVAMVAMEQFLVGVAGAAGVAEGLVEGLSTMGRAGPLLRRRPGRVALLDTPQSGRRTCIGCAGSSVVRESRCQ